MRETDVSGGRVPTSTAGLVLKIALVALTVVAMLSYGGLLLFVYPFVASAIWWIVKRSRHPLERAAWILLAALAGAEWAWEATYPVTEGRTPQTIVVSVVAGIFVAVILAPVRRDDRVRRPSS